MAEKEGVAKSSNYMIERCPRSIYARIQKESFVLLILSGFLAYFNKASVLGSRYAVSFTGNRCFPVRSFWIFACSLLRLYPIHSNSISSFTLVFPRSRNLWNS